MRLSLRIIVAVAVLVGVAGLHFAFSCWRMRRRATIAGAAENVPSQAMQSNQASPSESAAEPVFPTAAEGSIPLTDAAVQIWRSAASNQSISCRFIGQVISLTAIRPRQWRLSQLTCRERSRSSVPQKVPSYLPRTAGTRAAPSRRNTLPTRG